MDSNAVLKMIEGCPFAARSGMKVVLETDDTVTGILEDTAENMNAFGLVHAGAICGFMETAAGMALFRHAEPGSLLVLNTVFNIRFVHPPQGELRCGVRVSPEEFAKMREEVARAGRSDKAMDIKATDVSGNVVAQAQATFRLMPMPERHKHYFTG